MLENTITACVILNYNDSERVLSLVHKIKSFSAITYIVVVDNCSTDSSYEKLKTYESEKIRVLKTKQNKGYGAGNNHGIIYASNVLKASYAIVVNPDVSFDEMCTEKIFQTLREEKFSVVSPIMLYHGRIKYKTGWDLKGKYHYIVSLFQIFDYLFNQYYIYHQKKKFSSMEYVVCDCVNGSFLGLNIDDFMECGMFDEDNFLYNEENILGKKLKKNQRSTAIVTSIAYNHLHGGTISKSVKFKNNLQIWLDSCTYYLSNYHDLNKDGTIYKFIFKLVKIERMLLNEIIWRMKWIFG